jgi:transposase InsO family protein
MKASNCANFIERTFHFGQFQLWQCDNGKHLKNKTVRAAITNLGGKMITIAPYHPQANSQVERPNGTIKRLMRLEREEEPNLTWKDALDRALKKYNGKTHSTIKMTPQLAELLEVEDTHRITGYQNKCEIEFLNLSRENQLQRIDQLCQIRIAKAAEQMVKRWNKRHQPITYQVGEEVRVRPSQWRLRSKGEKMWKYRARIVSLIGTSYARLEWVQQGPKPEDLPGTVERKLWPLRNLAKYRGKTTSEMFGSLFEEEETNEHR